MKKFIITLLIIHCTLHIANAQWVQQYAGTTANLRACQMVSNTTAYLAGDSGIVMKTTNTGLNWARLNTGQHWALYCMDFADENTGYVAGDSPNYIIKTTNGGINWAIISNVTGASLYSISFLNSATGMVTGGSTQIAKTTNGGNAWQLFNPPGTLLELDGITMVDSNVAYAVGVRDNFNEGAIVKTTNGGANWTNKIGAYWLHSVSALNKDTVFAVGVGPCSYTTNGGTNWLTLYIGYVALFTVHYLTPDILTACGANSQIIRSTDGGLNWFRQNYILSGRTLPSISFSGVDTGISVGGYGTILTTTSGSLNGVKPISSEIPKSFKLYQNYPNPFNPTTKVNFSLPKKSFVGIIIYDALGKEIAILVNEQLNAGTYEVDWNASNYPSGVYYYRLLAGDFSETKKMVLIK